VLWNIEREDTYWFQTLCLHYLVVALFVEDLALPVGQGRLIWWNVAAHTRQSDFPGP